MPLILPWLPLSRRTPLLITSSNRHESRKAVRFRNTDYSINDSYQSRMVLTDPRFRAQLSGGHMTLPEAVEQTLWDEPPFTTIFGRWAVGDTELGGQRIKAGDALVVGIAAANVDPVVRPDVKASMQGNRAHLAFSGGPHECPGQDIGRAIADTGIDALLLRLPDLQLAVPEADLRWSASLMSRHLQELPVTFAARSPQDVAGPPSATPGHAPRTEWQVESPRPVPAQGASGAFAVPSPARPAGSPSVTTSEAPSAAPSAPPNPAGAIPAQRGPGAPARAWRTVVRWWRGY
ncbi:Pentalenolactone synthase [Streptomyces sp. S4.7]|nr:Pentalenolactone synthase [Streptomyces sp. S4.7]